MESRPIVPAFLSLPSPAPHWLSDPESDEDGEEEEERANRKTARGSEATNHKAARGVEAANKKPMQGSFKTKPVAGNKRARLDVIPQKDVEVEKMSTPGGAMEDGRAVAECQQEQANKPRSGGGDEGNSREHKGERKRSPNEQEEDPFVF